MLGPLILFRSHGSEFGRVRQVARRPQRVLSKLHLRNETVTARVNKLSVEVCVDKYSSTMSLLLWMLLLSRELIAKILVRAVKRQTPKHPEWKNMSGCVTAVRSLQCTGVLWLCFVHEEKEEGWRPNQTAGVVLRECIYKVVLQIRASLHPLPRGKLRPIRQRCCTSLFPGWYCN